MNDGAPAIASVARIDPEAELAQRQRLERLHKAEHPGAQCIAEEFIPNIELVARQKLQLAQDGRCIVSFFSDSASSYSYKIETDTDTYLMRMTLPDDPAYKTASEVSTISYVQQKTRMRLPQLVDWTLSAENVLGHEWTLLDLGSKLSLKESWKSLSMAEKRGIVVALAEHHAELFDCSFQEIGSLYCIQESFKVGLMTAEPFYWEDRNTREELRGPFCNSFHWLDSRLDLIREQQAGVLEEANDESFTGYEFGDVVTQDAQAAQELAKKLQHLLPTLFDPAAGPETSIFCHDHLSFSNILLDVDDKRNGPFIADWECVPLLPLWRACQLPDFLSGHIRSKEPKAENCGTEDRYQDQVFKYDIQHECEQLRKIFEARMSELRPQWMEEYRKGVVKRGFERAVCHCDNDFAFERTYAQKWLDAYHAGDQASLEELCNE